MHIRAWEVPPSTSLGQHFHFINEALTPRGEEAGPKLHSWFQSWLHHLPETLSKSFKNALTLTSLSYNTGYHTQLQVLVHAPDKTASKLGFVHATLTVTTVLALCSKATLPPPDTSLLLYRHDHSIGISQGVLCTSVLPFDLELVPK